MGVHYILEYFVWGRVQNILFVSKRYKISQWDAINPRILCVGVQNILEYYVWGYNILGGTKYPVTLRCVVIEKITFEN